MQLGVVGGGTEPFFRIATSLVRAGLPAVVAMQFEITDPAAIAFSHAFYRRLASTGDVDTATTEGRLAIRRQDRGSLEWITPVLLQRGYDGRLFKVPAWQQFLRCSGVRLAVAALVVLALGLSWWGYEVWSRPTVEKFLEEGRDAAKTGKLESAKKAFELALELDPKNVDVLADLGSVLSRQGNYSDAAGYLKEGLKHEPEARLHYRLGKVYSLMDQFEEAKVHLRWAKELDPKHARAFNELGLIYLEEEEDYGSARQILLEGLGSNPDEPLLHKNLGRVEFFEGKADEALRRFERAEQILSYKQDPPLALKGEIVYYKVQIYSRLRMTEEACADGTRFRDLGLDGMAEWSYQIREIAEEHGCHLYLRDPRKSQ